MREVWQVNMAFSSFPLSTLIGLVLLVATIQSNSVFAWRSLAWDTWSTAIGGIQLICEVSRGTARLEGFHDQEDKDIHGAHIIHMGKDKEKKALMFYRHTAILPSDGNFGPHDGSFQPKAVECYFAVSSQDTQWQIQAVQPVSVAQVCFRMCHSRSGCGCPVTLSCLRR
ncbi:hypothetical protein Baya_13793 [Bagarius yarrelli]|uniref:Uncharacterized protein n=1 Tax=Bagarius yarrelli TaxID=175774 RepID=A0A556V7I9_BAGYA|nr:hypothetical protein Baya_13793 [Bagarius yarrelli]